MEQNKLERRLVQAWPAFYQVATSAQLAEAGFGERLLATALDRRLVFRLRKGAYVRAAHWAALKPWDKDKLRILAHIMTVRGEPVYSYFTAARLHGLFIWNSDARIHVTGASASSGTSGARDVVQHHEAVPVTDSHSLLLRTGMSVTVTTLERTVVDCARAGGFAEAVIIGDHALSKGARMAVMLALVDSMPGRRGVRKARRVLHSLDGLSESPGESRTRLIIAGMAIDQPVLQKELLAGGRIYRPDFLWERQKLIVEFDGDIKYFAYERTDKVILEERKREKRLMELGWRFVRLEWKDLANPQEMKRRILAMYNAPFLAAVA
ncbi:MULTISPECIES: hypothetical protein [Arthrobacter]|uniref:hypothetical protein n=1 Tax=Arthrobacter TaxID=1663 RepID=UPI0028F6E836|nr:hypothetical protein [Arthrobacter sp. lap29]